jgi:hypothetical protein
MTTNVPKHSSSVFPPTFLTDHLALAAFLTCRGHAVTLVPTASGKIFFSFSQTESLNADAASFSEGTAQDSPVEYDTARIRLRQKMDALKGGVR